MSNLNKFLQSFKDDSNKGDEKKNVDVKDLIKNSNSLDEHLHSKVQSLKNEKSNPEDAKLFNIMDGSENRNDRIQNLKMEADDAPLNQISSNSNASSNRTLNLKSKGERRLKLNANGNDRTNKKPEVEIKPISQSTPSLQEIKRLEYIENRKREAAVKQELERDLKKAKMSELEGKNFNSDAQSFRKNEVEALFIESETPDMFRQKWFEFYEKALNSSKRTMTNQKVRSGRFRFNDKGEFEILPNFKTKGKSSNDLLHESWEIK